MLSGRIPVSIRKVLKLSKTLLYKDAVKKHRNLNIWCKKTFNSYFHYFLQCLVSEHKHGNSKNVRIEIR